MTWITDNWIVILLGVGFIAFHLFGHGGHGRRHKHGSDKKPVPPPPDTPSVPDPQAVAEEEPDKRPPESDAHKH